MTSLTDQRWPKLALCASPQYGGHFGQIKNIHTLHWYNNNPLSVTLCNSDVRPKPVLYIKYIIYIKSSQYGKHYCFQNNLADMKLLQMDNKRQNIIST